MNIIVNYFNYFYRTICHYICNPTKMHNITIVMHGMHMRFIHKCKQPEIASKASSPPLADPTHRLKRKSLRGAKIAVAIFHPRPSSPTLRKTFFGQLKNISYFCSRKCPERKGRKKNRLLTALLLFTFESKASETGDFILDNSSRREWTCFVVYPNNVYTLGVDFYGYTAGFIRRSS